MKTFNLSRVLFIAAICLFAHLPICLFAQNVGISATGVNPDNSAMLDVTSTTKGMLIPRMSGTDKYAIATPATGLLIYQTDTAGFWYYNGTKWIPLVSSTSSTASPSNAGWLTTGNSGTTASNFIGTTDSVSLRIRTNDTTRMIVNPIGRVGINTNIPYTVLDVRGPSGITSFTGNSVLGLNIGGSTSNNDYVGIDFRNTQGGSNPQARIGSYQAGSGSYLQFGTSNNYTSGITNTAMTIDPNGNVGIGTTTPYARLDLGSASSNQALFRLHPGTATGIYYPTATHHDLLMGSYLSGGLSQGYISTGFANSGRKFHIGTASNSLFDATTVFNPIFTVVDNGRVGIGCSAPQYALHVIGDIASSATIRGVNAYVTGAITACSDIRYKKDITPLSHALDKVLSMQGVNYYWKTKEFPEKQFTADNQIGFIAQELEKIIPEVVMTDKDGYKSVDYSRLTPVLVEAIKELKKENDSLKSEVGSMKTEIEKIKNTLSTTAETKK